MLPRGGLACARRPRHRLFCAPPASPTTLLFLRIFLVQDLIFFLQCDEGHPVCRNCVKSKRECLGYDPVFRPTASAPSAIQPAPNPPPSLVVNPQGPPVAAAPLYPSAPPGYMPASSQPFAPSLHSESPSTSTDHQTDHRASVDTSIAPPHTQQAPTTMQASHEPRPQSSEPVYKGTRTTLVDFPFFLVCDFGVIERKLTSATNSEKPSCQ